MTKPLIGVIPSLSDELDSYKLYTRYVDLIFMAGGNAVLLPYDFTGGDFLDGVLFTGGGDLSPDNASFDRPELCREVILRRDEAERRLFDTAFSRGLPMLGICRGEQLLNAMTGGTLIADLPATGCTEDHYLGKKGYHPVISKPNTLAERCFGLSGAVWSTHHQAVDRPGDGFTVTAASPAGVVEAIEHSSGKMLGLQTHPERMGLITPFKWLADMC